MQTFDVIIIGGSFAGLAAAMTLGRSRRKVLVIDAGSPCNKQTPHSHNFLTQDGKSPAEISKLAKAQVSKYPTVEFLEGFAQKAEKADTHFRVILDSGKEYTAKKLLLATGLKDQMPKKDGFAASWGISILHCPYCHGYEVVDKKIGIWGNGDAGFALAKLISNWSDKITLFTDGQSTLSAEQQQSLDKHHILLNEKEFVGFAHREGQVNKILFADGSAENLEAVFARVPFVQHSDIPKQLSCAFDEHGFVQVDEYQSTSVFGVFAAGDNTTGFRSVAMAVAAGSKAAAIINHQLIDEIF
ncbi:NAD(P)/FAD-dependent oxidoreductase [Marinilongibacter aquaticus]|uniref:NAD(P)/FAD-dependent oxidoreductase n=1 Tax=Marinilongibacter aquaticus TaxID=2975157 RepID=UPI0021BD300A|nr:NAD(P)/FAD-dependent oxidoreductase [Marinilongibacter aquaticus]UBM58290.1 NAD(P)/FAD-dependent oxidoreductase [Marinilongibacter aquaticus]